MEIDAYGKLSFRKERGQGILLKVFDTSKYKTRICNSKEDVDTDLVFIESFNVTLNIPIRLMTKEE
ncbi:unnamed protein product [Sphenostylis stenocarpa]|uniref:Uncharacterized protein n=1 Tax=Sphenostylis stenocarpa TaxID=92480 RepID=A0AA86SP19_9FABA|nr:unnamed protein product [Sphenostylis stenocarpa]